MNRRTLLALMLTAGCATTQIKTTWKDPSVTKLPAFQKIAVIGFARDEATRRAVEDQISKIIGSGKTVPSYTFIALAQLRDADAIKAKVNQTGADGLITVSPLDVRKEVNYQPGTIAPGYSSPWAYTSVASGRFYSAGYFDTDTIVRLETNIFSVTEEKLLWSATSETMNPGEIRGEVDTLARAIRAELKKQNLLPQQKS